MKKIITSVGLSLSLLAGSTSIAGNPNLIKGTAGTLKTFSLSPNFKEGVNYVGGHIIFKIKEQYRSKCSVSYINEPVLTQAFNYLGVNTLAKIYPRIEAPKTKYNKLGQAYADLSLVYEITFQNKNISLEKAINQLLATGFFEYADPRYIRQVSTFFPNDPKANSTTATQYKYLNQINAYNAWDTALGGTQGDTTVVIGIVDSGTDLVHPDLMANFKHNYGEIPGNLIDDDNDGYVDNYTGWDLAGGDYNNVVGDSDPQIKGANNVHGSYVSGDASAVTNNGVGVAGVGFNCKLLPVKCAADNDMRGGTPSVPEGYIITGYEGIQYAADHGAKVINCSWGGAGGSSYEQATITYASINKNCLVVAAAGNGGAEESFYPATYDYVLAVAAVSSNDGKASFSNFGFNVDLSAPGVSIYNTAYSQSYNNPSGTSMASPITAGGAALVLSKYSSYTGLQAGQRLIATTDNNYSVPSNSIYANKLGSGRLNLFSAVTSTVAAQNESIVLEHDSLTDHNDLIFTQGDVLYISGNFINYLTPTTNAVATISIYSGGTGLTAGNTNFNIGSLATNASKNNFTTPFTYNIGNAPANSTVVFKVTITDGAYSQNYFLSVPLNPDYVNIVINQVHTTITSKGKIGYSQDAQVAGLGFSYNGDALLYEAGLMVGTSTTSVADCIRGTSTTGASDTDFATVLTAHKVIPSVFSEFDVNGQFSDANASPVQHLLVRHNAYAWSTPGSSKFVIVEYIIHNSGTSALNNLYAGIFADWDVDATTTLNPDKSNYDATRKLGYTYATTTGGKYAGIQVLTNTNPNSYAIDNLTSGYGGVKIATTAGFSKADKYTTLSTMRQTAGDSTAAGNDVCQVVSSGPFTIAAGDSVKVAFALLAGDGLTDLQASADTAYIRYNAINPTGIKKVNFQNFSVYPNPAVDGLNFVFNSTESDNCTISILNTLGQTVKVISTNIPANTLHKVTVDVSDLATGAYMYKIVNAAGQANTGKIVVRH